MCTSACHYVTDVSESLSLQAEHSALSLVLSNFPLEIDFNLPVKANLFAFMSYCRV